METFYFSVPVGNGKPADETVEYFVSLIPFGEENAVKRDFLTCLCKEAGLVDKDIKDADRAMRSLMQKAKMDYAICNVGKGYFRPLPKNKHVLKTCIEKERSRVKALLGSLVTMEKLYEDYERERITEGSE